jgi:hypothetical protein
LTSYCYLLRLEAHRDGDTWGVHLLDLRERGLDPDAIVADAGSGLRAGLKAALPDVPCRSPGAPGFFTLSKRFRMSPSPWKTRLIKR